MKVILNLRDIEIRVFLEYLDTAIEDYVVWLQDIPAKTDPSPESREKFKRELRVLRKLRRQMAGLLEGS